MIEINLLPEELKKKESHFKKIDMSSLTQNLNLQKLPVIPIAIGIVAVFIIIHAVLFFVGRYNMTTIASLTKKSSALLTNKKEAEIMQAEVDSINKRANAIDALMVKRFSWSHLLNALSDSVASGIWFYELSYEERMAERTVPAVRNEAVSMPIKGKPMMAQQAPSAPTTEKVLTGYLVLSGYASSMGEGGTALVGKFIKGLKDNPELYSNFSNIELGSIKSDKVADQEVMNFRVTCSFK